MSEYEEIAPDAVAPNQKTAIPDRPLKHLDTVVALYDFPGTQPSHLPLTLGDTVFVLSKSQSGWWDGVIVNPDGDLLRGWFPKNYARLVNYVQPVLKQLKNNKEIDSLTAANTAANVLIPSFTSLLQKSLGESEKSTPGTTSRKNSVVSFASSDTSDRQQPLNQTAPPIPPPATNTSASTPSQTSASGPLGLASTSSLNLLQQSPQHKFSSFSSTFTHQQSISTITSSGKSEDNFIEDQDEVEELIRQFREKNKDFKKQLVWQVKTTTDGNFAFYNEQLDVFTSVLPMSTYDKERDAQLEIDIPSAKALNDTSVVRRHQSFSQLSGHQTDEDEDDGLASGRNGGSVGLAGDISEDLTTEGEDYHSNSHVPIPESTHSKEYESLKRASISSLTQSSTGAFYHNFDQPFFVTKGLFYEQAGDPTHWSLFRESFNFILQLTWKSLQESNKHLFSTHFKSLNRIISILFSSLRLQQDDYNGKREERHIRKKMKKIASSYASIYTNGVLHLSVMHYSTGISKQLFSMKMSGLNKSTSEPTTTVTSVSLTATVIPIHQSMSTMTQAASDEMNRKFKELAETQFHTTSQETSKTEIPPISTRTEGSVVFDEEPTKSSTPPTPTEEYYDQLQLDIDLLKSNFDSLVDILLKITKDKKIWQRDYNGGSDTSDDEGQDRYDTLPQTLPRFIAGEFNGGNWCNPFFSKTQRVLNASGDELKTRYHLKLIIDREAYKSILNFSDGMKKLSEETLKYLDPKVQKNYFNDHLKSERNTHILRLIYKYLYYAGLVVDILEAFDFTVFCLIKKFSSIESGEAGIGDYDDTAIKRNLTFDYPVVLEFFEHKQKLHDIISEIVMSTQQLSLEDPEVFKGMKEDDTLLYNRDLVKDPKEKAARLLINIILENNNKIKSDSIALNPDVMLLKSLNNGMSFIDDVLIIIQQLIDERETILNYATRVMHDDFNVQLLVIERNNTILSDKSEESQGFYAGDSEGGPTAQVSGSVATSGGSGIPGSISGGPGVSGSRKKTNDTLWFLEGDEDYDLLLDLKGNIKGGSKEALIAHLTHHETYDSSFNASFLVTFPTIMSLGECINLLIQRFNIEAPEGLSYEEYNTWISKKQHPIRNRVLNIMRLLIEKYWFKSYFNNKSIIKRWLNFIQAPSIQQLPGSKAVFTGLLKISMGESVVVNNKPIIASTKAPAPIIKSSSLLKKLKLLDIDYIELARQLTLREYRLYSKIDRAACIMKVWGRKSGLNESFDTITTFIKASNQLTNFVAYMILRKQDIRKRVQLIRFFVQVAEKCRVYNNYSSMTAIISALYSSPIHRLKKTWKLVATDTLSHLQNMNKLMNSTRNFNEYRDVLKFVTQEPCVPFFGVYLSDLTFVYHGNQDYLMNRPRMINFAKRAKTYEIISGMERFKAYGYNLQDVKEIQDYLNSWFDKCPTIDEQYQLSLNLEPREPSKKKPKSLS